MLIHLPISESSVYMFGFAGHGKLVHRVMLRAAMVRMQSGVFSIGAGGH